MSYKSYVETESSELEEIAQAVLSYPAVTRDGKDRDALKRALEAFIENLRAQEAKS